MRIEKEYFAESICRKIENSSSIRMMKLEIIPTSLLSEYLDQAPRDLQANFDALHEAEISTSTLELFCISRQSAR